MAPRLHLRRCVSILAALVCLVAVRPAAGQAFSEGFDDITLLAGNGWFMQNNSSPLGITNWFQGTSVAGGGPFDAYDGAANAYIGANFNNTTGGTGTISNWLLTPNRTFRNGDVLTFYTRRPTTPSGGTEYPDRLEVRLSTNGASTNVGSTASGVGDFTTLLLSVNPTLVTNVYPAVWTQYTVTISGLPAPTSGRVGFRYFVTGAGPTGANSDYIGIDRVAYTPYVCPALTISPATVPGGQVGVAYSQSLSQTGALGAPGYAITGGALPPNLTLSAAGLISGTPTAHGTFNFTVTVSDASGCSGSQAYSITVAMGAATVQITNLSQTYDATPKPVTVTTTPSLAYAVTYDGSPTVPTNAGSYAVVATVTDPEYAGTASATLVVAQRAVTITADPKSKAYGAPDPALTYQVTAGSLAGADAFAGALSRNPGEAIGSYAILQNTVALSANYALSYVGANLTIGVASTTTAVTPSPASAVVGGSITLTATVAAVPPATGTPTGTVTFTDGAATLCSAPLDGSGVASCSFNAALPVGAHTATASYAGDMNFGASTGSTGYSVTGTVPTIAGPTSPMFLVGIPGSVTFTTTGNPTPTLSITAGSLPAGISFIDNGNGTATISGTATAPGSYPVTINAHNAAGDAPLSITVVVAVSAGAVPTLGGWGLMALGAALAGAGLLLLRRLSA